MTNLKKTDSKFIDHIQEQGVKLGEENDIQVVLDAMASFHVNSSVDNILDAFPIMKEVQDSGGTIHVRSYLNARVDDVKLSINNSTNGPLIDGGSGQPSHHVS